MFLPVVIELFKSAIRPVSCAPKFVTGFEKIAVKNALVFGPPGRKQPVIVVSFTSSISSTDASQPIPVPRSIMIFAESLFGKYIDESLLFCCGQLCLDIISFQTHCIVTRRRRFFCVKKENNNPSMVYLPLLSA
jgi:hypothetical protein